MRVDRPVLTRAALVEEIETRAARAWTRWSAFYGDLDASPWIGGLKPMPKALGLLLVVIGAALTAINPDWTVDLDLDHDGRPVGVLVQDGGRITEIALITTARKVRVSSAGYGCGDSVTVGIAAPGAGRRMLEALSRAIVPALIPAAPEPIHV